LRHGVLLPTFSKAFGVSTHGCILFKNHPE